MISRFQNSSLLEKDNEYRPLLFRSSGTDKGAPELFPVGPKARRKNVHEEDGMSKGVPLKNVIEDPDGA